MEILLDYNIWISLFTLTILEIILGVDNVIFIALAVGHLEEKQRDKARYIGLSLALIFRIIMLFGLVWIIGLTEPWITIANFEISGKNLMMLIGGTFLIYKSTEGIHDEVTGYQAAKLSSYSGAFVATIVQILFIDLIFSFDSVITAVGITHNIYVIIAAMVISMVVMLLSSGFIAEFIEKNPAFKMLALSFVMMIGVFLIAEGLNFHVPKGYIYFSMSLSLTLEILNMKIRQRKQISSQLK